MKKDLGALPAVFPMPVLMVAAYDENGVPNVMNAAWGQICGTDKIALFISKPHKTTKNILATGAFTVALADKDHVAPADYVGIASGNNTADKFAKSGLHETKSKFVNAPVIEEFPLTMECELLETVETDNVYMTVGKIVNVLAEESVLAENGKVDPAKLNVIAFDNFQSGYYEIGDQVATAWNAGKALMD